MPPKKDIKKTADLSLLPPSLSAQVTRMIANYKEYCPAFLKIQTPDGKLESFKLNEVQDLLEEIIKDIRKDGRLVRLVILKSRRKGVTTWTASRFFHKISTNRNRQAMMITHEPEATDFVFKMHKRFDDHLPSALKPDKRLNNKKILEYNNDQGTGLDSSLRVGTAGKEDLGSGTLIHYLHLSELSKWAKYIATPLLLSVFQCVPSTEDSEIIIESTAKGVGGEFHDRYWKSRTKYTYILEDGKPGPTLKKEINLSASEDNEYSSIFIPWYAFARYERTPAKDFRRTEEEEEIVKQFNLNYQGRADHKLSWRRHTLENQTDGDLDKFHQEYPADEMEAFLSESDNVFNVKQLKAMIDEAKEPIARYNVSEVTGICEASPKGRLVVWQEPQVGHLYVVAGDVSEGLAHGDFSCLDVIDTVTMKQVAQWHGKIAPDILGKLAVFIGRRYVNAKIAIERNNHGITTIDTIIDMDYKNIYVETITTPPARPRKRYGWVSTKTSKPRIIDNLVTMMREDPSRVICKGTMDEMMMYKQFEDGSTGAELNRFDDRVMSLAIGMYISSKLTIKARQGLDMRRENIYNSGKKTPGQPGPITSESWT
jgi:hypothetical protein